jgi:hypothetical protein
MEAMQPFSPDKEKLGEICKFFLHFGVNVQKFTQAANLIGYYRHLDR